jgi:hypothetical protein
MKYFEEEWGYIIGSITGKIVETFKNKEQARIKIQTRVIIHLPVVHVYYVYNKHWCRSN